MLERAFSDTLTNLRQAAGLTNRELADAAHVPVSLIAGLQSGKRRVGEVNARQIGVALGLRDEVLQTFVLEAMSTCTRKVLQEAQGYPAHLINTIARQLRRCGVLPEQVRECTSSGQEVGEITLKLTDGRTARLETHLVLS